ncbi:MAG: hypothetical protein J4G14_09500, partial [Dehalococcoidia bacterium]|nr:hypothetical protein [Dehalococcoidia bacterium]
MSLSQYIRDNTDDGKIVARVLIDVLEGRLDGAKIGHRLTAARLLTIYGHEDADDFIADNTPHVSDRDWSQRVQVEVDPAISSYIKQRSDGGREICQFLIDVVKGEIEGIRVGHRVWAAKELLNRAYGKSQGRPLPKPPGSTSTRRQPRKTHPQPVTPVYAASAAVLDEPERQSDHEIDPRIDIVRDVQDWLDICDTPRYEFMEECQHPDFDPYVATIDEEYFQSFTACQDP